MMKSPVIAFAFGRAQGHRPTGRACPSRPLPAVCVTPASCPKRSVVNRLWGRTLNA